MNEEINVAKNCGAIFYCGKDDHHYECLFTDEQLEAFVNIIRKNAFEAVSEQCAGWAEEVREGADDEWAAFMIVAHFFHQKAKEMK